MNPYELATECYDAFEEGYEKGYSDFEEEIENRPKQGEFSPEDKKNNCVGTRPSY